MSRLKSPLGKPPLEIPRLETIFEEPSWDSDDAITSKYTCKSNKEGSKRGDATSSSSLPRKTKTKVRRLIYSSSSSGRIDLSWHQLFPIGESTMAGAYAEISPQEDRNIPAEESALAIPTDGPGQVDIDEDLVPVCPEHELRCTFETDNSRIQDDTDEPVSKSESPADVDMSTRIAFDPESGFARFSIENNQPETSGLPEEPVSKLHEMPFSYFQGDILVHERPVTHLRSHVGSVSLPSPWNRTSREGEALPFDEISQLDLQITKVTGTMADLSLNPIQ